VCLKPAPRRSPGGAGLWRLPGKDWVWLLVSPAASADGGLFIYVAIGEKNATLC
jgi:hypothetical protein